MRHIGYMAGADCGRAWNFVRYDVMTKMPDDQEPDLLAGLEAPSDAADARAKQLFARLLGMPTGAPERGHGRAVGRTPRDLGPSDAARVLGRALASWPDADTIASARGADAPRVFGGGRKYDVALSMVMDLDAATQAISDDASVDPAVDAATEAGRTTDRSEPVAEVTQPFYRPPSFPPAGVPMVRKSAPPTRRAEAVSQDLLEQAADTALLMTEGDGTTSFQISFHDDVFADLACTIAVRASRVTATFRVRDENLRRLLEAESGRLRVSLESRGLKVEDVRVVVED